MQSSKSDIKTSAPGSSILLGSQGASEPGKMSPACHSETGQPSVACTGIQKNVHEPPHSVPGTSSMAAVTLAVTLSLRTEREIPGREGTTTHPHRKKKKICFALPQRPPSTHSNACRIRYPSSEFLGSTKPPFLATKRQPPLGRQQG